MVRGLDSSGDFTFGRGLSNYSKQDDEIKQKVVTRIKSFKYDWFLNESSHIDWHGILGKYGNAPVIQSEVERVIIQTEGVLIASVNNTNLDTQTRVLTLEISITTIYNNEYNININLDI